MYFRNTVYEKRPLIISLNEGTIQPIKVFELYSRTAEDEVMQSDGSEDEGLLVEDLHRRNSTRGLITARITDKVQCPHH